MSNSPLIEKQKAYLLQCQLPSGAFRLSPKSDRINPYFANLALLPLVILGEYDAVARYLDWYIQHLNRDGYINDFRLQGGIELDTGKADSEDSYHTTFFSLLASYVEQSGRRSVITAYSKELATMLHAVLRLQQTDGLTWAKRSWKVKYLMDNCEVWKGLQDISSLFALIGEQALAELAMKAARHCETGLKGMYSAKRKSYAVYDRVYPKWHKWYPDATSQAFPLLYGLLSPSSAEARELYQQLLLHFPDFQSFWTGDFYPWMIMGQYAWLMDDANRVARMLAVAEELYIYGPRSGYWLIHEAARYLMLKLYLEGDLPGPE